MGTLNTLVANAPRVCGEEYLFSKGNLSKQEVVLLGRYLPLNSPEEVYACDSCNSCGSGDCNSCCSVSDD